MSVASKDEVEGLLYQEARLLDEQNYQAWLGLYSGDATYWMPAWISESELARDPKKELSLIYLNRKMLELYVQRIYTGDAHSFVPPSRTSRAITNIEIGGQEEGAQKVSCKWQMQVYRARRLYQYFGTAEFKLRRVDGLLKIGSKKVTLINDWIRDGQLFVV